MKGTMLLAVFVALAATPAAALDIALTNDDGWQAEGIQALYRALRDAGHTVTLAAPADEQSGSSASIDIGKDLRVRREEADQFSIRVCADPDCSAQVSAEPATSAMIAIDIATRRAQGRAPALLVSGVNAGNNTGAATPISGTVGAAIAAISQPFNGAVPAIAISTDVPVACGADTDCIRSHYDAVSAFLVQLVSELERHAGPGHALLPSGLALNVNYPSGPPKGVKLAVQGRSIPLGGVARDLSLRCETCLDVAVGDAAPAGLRGMREDRSPDVRDSDVARFTEGYVTIVPIEADYTARSRRGLGWLERLRLDARRNEPATSTAEH
jgi:5'-nucleotidase